MTIIDVIFKAIDWIQENVSGKLKWILLAAVALVILMGVLLKNRESIASFLNMFNTAKTRKTEYLTDGPVRVRENFQFRDKLVKKQSKQIRKAMKTRQNKFLIHGFGGVGKTAVAAALYDALEDKCERIGWVECQESGSLRDSLLAAIDTGAGEKTTEERWSEIKDLLRNATGKTILFLDNVDRPDELLTELRRYKLTVIVTSRMERVEDYTSIPIPPLSEDECVALFRSYCYRTVKEQDEPVVRDLVRLVSCHTLSVELLAKGVPAKVSFAEYLEQLKAKGFGFPGLKFRTGHDRENRTVVEHLKKLFDMAKLDKEPTRVMQNLALMADSRTLPADVQDWIGCDENVLDGLVRTGWLTRTEDENKRGGYEVHPIVREIVLLDEVPVEAVEKFLECVADGEAIEKYFQGEDYRAVQFKLGIVEVVLEQVEDELKKSRETASIYVNLGIVYDDQGDYDHAEKYYQKALDIAIEVLGKSDLDTANSYNNLGVVFDNQGKYVQAEDCHKNALSIRLELVGEEHPYTATSYHNLGNVYFALKKYEQAEVHYKKALGIYRKVHWERYPYAADSYDNLGCVYGKQKKYDQAEKYHEKALNIRLVLLGEEHPDTASSYNNLGADCEDQKKYIEAVELYLKAWKIRQQKLGPEHPETKRTVSNLRRCFPHIDHGDQDFDTWLSQQ